MIHFNRVVSNFFVALAIGIPLCYHSAEVFLLDISFEWLVFSHRGGAGGKHCYRLSVFVMDPC